MGKLFLTPIVLRQTAQEAPYSGEVHLFTDDGIFLYTASAAVLKQRVLTTFDIGSGVPPTGTQSDDIPTGTQVREALDSVVGSGTQWNGAITAANVHNGSTNIYITKGINHYVFTGGASGTVPTYYLPAANTASLRVFFVQNAGLRNITVTSAGPDNFKFDGGTVSVFQLKPGEWAVITTNSVVANTWYVMASLEGSSGGGLTSVGLSMPNIFNVSNSPLTANGTITTSLVSQLRSRFFASPPTADGVPTFRPITLYDLPILPYDKYDSWLICIPGLPEIEVGGVNSVTKYTGITMKAGTGIAIYSEASLSNSTLEVTIESTVKPALLNETALTSNSSTLVANNWTTILELPVSETGIYQFNFHVSLSKVGTGAAHIAARLAVNGSAVIGSVETYTSGYKASLSGSGSFNFAFLGRDKITLQVFTNSASWVAVANTVTSSSGKATQLSSLKIS